MTVTRAVFALPSNENAPDPSACTETPVAAIVALATVAPVSDSVIRPLNVGRAGAGVGVGEGVGVGVGDGDGAGDGGGDGEVDDPPHAAHTIARATINCRTS